MAIEILVILSQELIAVAPDKILSLKWFFYHIQIGILFRDLWQALDRNLLVKELIFLIVEVRDEPDGEDNQSWSDEHRDNLSSSPCCGRVPDILP